MCRRAIARESPGTWHSGNHRGSSRCTTWRALGWINLVLAGQREKAPPHLRGRVSAVVGMSFFGLMPIAGLIIPGLADLIGMRTILTIASVIYGIAAFSVLSIAGRHVCDQPVSPAPEPEIEPVC